MSNSGGNWDWRGPHSVAEYQDTTLAQHDEEGDCEYDDIPEDHSYTYHAAGSGGSSYQPAFQLRSSPDLPTLYSSNMNTGDQEHTSTYDAEIGSYGYPLSAGHNRDESDYYHRTLAGTHHRAESFATASRTATRDFATSNPYADSDRNHFPATYEIGSQAISQVNIENRPGVYQGHYQAQFVDEPEHMGTDSDGNDSNARGRDQPGSGHSFSSNEPNQGSVKGDGCDERRIERRRRPDHSRAAINRLGPNNPIGTADYVGRQQALKSDIEKYGSTIAHPKSISSSSKEKKNKDKSTRTSAATAHSSSRPRSVDKGKKETNGSKKPHREGR